MWGIGFVSSGLPQRNVSFDRLLSLGVVIHPHSVTVQYLDMPAAASLKKPDLVIWGKSALASVGFLAKSDNIFPHTKECDNRNDILYQYLPHCPI